MQVVEGHKQPLAVIRRAIGRPLVQVSNTPAEQVIEQYDAQLQRYADAWLLHEPEADIMLGMYLPSQQHWIYRHSAENKWIISHEPISEKA